MISHVKLSSVRDDLNSVRLRASSLAAITSTPHEQAKSEESATSRFEETNNQLVDDIISSGDGDQADLLGGIIGRMPPGNHQQKGGVAHRHFRHEGGRLKYDVEVAKAAIRGLEHIQARLEKDAAQVRHNLSVVYGDILHVESVTTRLSNRTGTLETHVALADHQMSAVRDQLRELATKSERQAADIRNMSEAVSSVDKLHTSTVQLFEALEALEEKLGKSVADLQKDVSRFDFNMAQMQSTMDILREDQSSNLATLKTIKKEQALARLEMQKDHYQLMAVRNEVLNWSLQECRHNNADALHALKVANMNAQLNKLATRVDGQAREIEALHGRVRTKADNSAIQGLENKTKALDERLENVSLDVPLLEGRVNNVHKQLAKFVRTLPADCSRLSQGLSSPSMSYKSGVHLIHPGDLDSAVEVYCDMETDGGEWTVIQRRQDGTEDFYRDWDEYAEGFGRLDGEYWLGNRAIHELTKRANYTLRLDMWDTAGHYKYAQYTHFVVASEDDDFRLSLGGYNGNASDAMYYHNQMAFSTRDRDNDASSTHCATYYSSGWWYNHCQYVNINGRYNIGLTWYDIDEHEWVQLTRVEMKVRPAKETSVHEPT